MGEVASRTPHSSQARRRPPDYKPQQNSTSSCLTHMNRKECGVDNGSGAVGLTTLKRRDEASGSQSDEAH